MLTGSEGFILRSESDTNMCVARSNYEYDMAESTGLKCLCFRLWHTNFRRALYLALVEVVRIAYLHWSDNIHLYKVCVDVLLER